MAGKKQQKYNQNTVIRGALRRAFARSPVVREKMDESRQEFPRYKKDGSRHKKNWVKRQCETCNEWAISKEINVDHVDPVISVEEGFIDWNTYVSRLWCDIDNLKRICKRCHDAKTAQERFHRNLLKDEQLISEIEESLDRLSKSELSKSLRKFTGKKLSAYPESFAKRVECLKKYLRSIKT